MNYILADDALRGLNARAWRAFYADLIEPIPWYVVSEMGGIFLLIESQQ